MPIPETAPERRTRSDRRKPAAHPIGDELRKALERGEIEILFQPQFASADGTLVGAEALARAALGAAGNWRVPLRLSLNVTAADVAAGNFAENIAGAVAEAGFPPEHLTLEITEQVLVADLERTGRRLRQLADLGIRIALDDFGAGFCNFHYLKRLPIHALKLDRSMIEGVADDPRDLEVLRGILAMARALHLDVVAEGVEREEQRAAIAREGCASWQGFLGAKPMPGVEFAALAGA